MTELPPVRREILVPADPQTAYRVFTEDIGSWWPLDGFSVYGERASVSFVGDRIVETAPGQPDTLWGTVIASDPAHSLSFSWHPGAPPEKGGTVSVTFTAQGAQTLVRLEHAGWEHYSDPSAARVEYDQGWPVVLAAYAGLAATRPAR